MDKIEILHANMNDKIDIIFKNPNHYLPHPHLPSQPMTNHHIVTRSSNNTSINHKKNITIAIEAPPSIFSYSIVVKYGNKT